MNPSFNSAALDTQGYSFQAAGVAPQPGSGTAQIQSAPTEKSGSGRQKGSKAQSGPLPRALMQEWLAWQCQMLSGVISGALFLPGKPGHVCAPVAIWPDQKESVTYLNDIADRAIIERRGLIFPRQQCDQNGYQNCDLMTCPLLVDEDPVAVIVVAITARPEPQQRAVLQLMQWGAMWMESMAGQHAATQREQSAILFELVSAALEQVPLRAVAMKIANLLADRLECECVSVGLRHGMQIRLEALSQVARFDPRTQLVHAIEAAMEEAVDQETTLIEPEDSQRAPVVTRAHTQLANRQGNHTVCTLPLPGSTKAIGAITLERDANRPFDPDTVALCTTAATLIGPALELKRREARPPVVKIVQSLGTGAIQLFGASHLKLKLALLSAAALVALLSTVQGEYRITSPATLEGEIQQAVVAPQEGYILSAGARAGDLVEKGDTLASLDDRDLRLQRQKWQSEREKHLKEYHEALAKHDRTGLSILRARIDQSDAELRLVDEKIERTHLQAPFDGVVVSGDLSRSLGAPVETGEVLFQVAPLDSYRVVLQVDEQDIAGITPGQPGKLVIAALPETPMNITVDNITPMASTGKNGNYFRVEATLETPTPALRPGMQGVAKVEKGERSLLWIWTHGVIDGLRLWAWSLGL
jgi:RND family efflux transporter MFP subunit